MDKAGRRYNTGKVAAMVIALNPEQAQIIDQAIEAGLIEKAEDAVELGVGTIRRRLETKALRANNLSHEE